MTPPPATLTDDPIRRQELAHLGITAEVATDGDGTSVVTLATAELDRICEARHLIEHEDDLHDIGGLHDGCWTDTDLAASVTDGYDAALADIRKLAADQEKAG